MPRACSSGRTKQHREEPRAATDPCGREADDPPASRSATRKRPGSVARRCATERDEGCPGVPRDEGGVPVERAGTRRTARPGATVRARSRGPPSTAGRSPIPSSAPGRRHSGAPAPSAGAPVASRSSSACMNASRSPSRTAGRVARLVRGPVVLHHLVRVEDVAADLVPPARLDVLAPQLAPLGLPLLERALQQPGLEDLRRRLLVLDLRPLVLALGDDAGRAGA